MRDWFRALAPSGRRQAFEQDPDAQLAGEPCLNCGANLKSSPQFARYYVCPECHYHYTMPARKRIEILADPESFKESNRHLTTQDAVQAASRSRYRSQLREARRRTGLSEAVVTGECNIVGREVVLAIIDFGFLGGTVGSVVAEKITRAFELAARRKLPIVTVISSSGARTPEGPSTIMQAGKMLAAVRRLSAERVPHISILTSPTTGGIYAAFNNVADVILSELGAIVGFAPRGTITGGPMPQNFDTAEAYLERGAIDQVVDRLEQRELLSVIVDLLGWRYRLTLAGRWRRQLYETPSLPVLQTLQLAHHEQRPTSVDYISHMTSTFVELHGDRINRDATNVICGLADLGGEAVMIISQQRPQQSEQEPRHGAWIAPEGFRKARRAMLMAAKFHLPMISLIDSHGASLSLDAEQRGIGYAVAQCVATMSDLPTPAIAGIIGEANGEGFLAFGMADRTLMLENAIYSPALPNDGLEIDQSRSEVYLGANDCRELGLIDEIVYEPSGGAHTDHPEAARLLKGAILRHLAELQPQPIRRLLALRYKRFRNFGHYSNIRSALYQPVGKIRRRFIHEARGALARVFPSLKPRQPDDSQDISIP